MPEHDLPDYVLKAQAEINKQLLAAPAQPAGGGGEVGEFRERVNGYIRTLNGHDCTCSVCIDTGELIGVLDDLAAALAQQSAQYAELRRAAGEMARTLNGYRACAEMPLDCTPCQYYTNSGPDGCMLEKQCIELVARPEVAALLGGEEVKP
jgi:hypothetical protein